MISRLGWGYCEVMERMQYYVRHKKGPGEAEPRQVFGDKAAQAIYDIVKEKPTYDNVNILQVFKYFLDPAQQVKVAELAKKAAPPRPAAAAPAPAPKKKAKKAGVVEESADDTFLAELCH